MNIEEAAVKIESHIQAGESKQWCLDLCKVWDINLIYAIERNYVEIVELLIEAGEDVNGKEYNPLAIAIKRGSIEVVKVLIKNGVDVNRSIVSPLVIASKTGVYDIVKILFEHYTFSSEELFKALQVSTKNNFIGVVRCLLDNGADPFDVADVKHYCHGSAAKVAEIYQRYMILHIFDQWKNRKERNKTNNNLKEH